MEIDFENELKNSTKKSSPSDDTLDFLMPWKKLNSLKDQEFSKEWRRLKKQVEESENRLVSRRQNSQKLLEPRLAENLRKMEERVEPD